MKCCGAEIITPYCPLCGNRVNPEATIETLIAHLSHKLRLAEQCIVRANKLVREDGESEWKKSNCAAKVPSWEQQVAQYKVWIDLLSCKTS